MALAEILLVAPSGFNTTTNHNPHPVVPPRVLAIVDELCAEWNLERWRVLCGKRGRLVDQVRGMAMRRCRDEIIICGRPASYPQIGAWFQRDHTTVMFACGALKKPPRRAPKP